MSLATLLEQAAVALERGDAEAASSSIALAAALCEGGPALEQDEHAAASASFARATAAAEALRERLAAELRSAGTSRTAIDRYHTR